MIGQLYKLSNGETSSLPILTSGSTGSPKEIHFSIDELAASADLSITALKLNPKSRLLLCLTLSGVGGLMILVRTMRIGAELITVKPSSMIHPSMFDNQTINWTSMTPHQLANSEESFNFIENVLIGGAALSENTLSGLTLKPKRIVESYGMTETLSHIALRERYPMSERFFKTLDTIKISKAENGALLIDTPYLRTKKHLTNDEVELVDECHFDMIGRLDDVINTGE